MGVLEFLKGKTKNPAEDSDDIKPGELQEAGVEIKKGDTRLKNGVTYDNLSSSERQRLDDSRKKKRGG